MCFFIPVALFVIVMIVLVSILFVLCVIGGTNSSKFFLILLCSSVCSFADNPVCDNTEEYQIYEKRCYSFGDEFVFVSKGWPEYNDGEEKTEEGTTCFEKFRASEDENVEKFSKNGIHYVVYALDQYCCKHKVFRTKEARWGNEDNGYKDFSYYGTFGIFYSECEYQESDRVKVQFAETKLQKPLDKVDGLNFITDVEKVFGSREKAMVKVGVLASLENKGETIFKIYRQNGSVKYIGGVDLGFCMSKNGKKALDFAKGPSDCK